MSLKAVELQVALPRTQEISRIQDQQQQRTMHEALIHQSEQNRLDEQHRQRAGDVNETTKGQIKDKQERHNKQNKQETASQQDGTSDKEPTVGDERSLMHDPLRGRHIDISL